MRGLRWLAVSVVMGALLVGSVGGTTGEAVAPGRVAPELVAGAWINSAPLTMAGLRGRVVLVEFWTYG